MVHLCTLRCKDDCILVLFLCNHGMLYFSVQALILLIMALMIWSVIQLCFWIRGPGVDCRCFMNPNIHNLLLNGSAWPHLLKRILSSMEVPALHYHSHQLETCILYTSHWTLNELSLKSLCKKVHTDLFFATIWPAVLKEVDLPSTSEQCSRPASHACSRWRQFRMNKLNQ